MRRVLPSCGSICCLLVSSEGGKGLPQFCATYVVTRSLVLRRAPYLVYVVATLKSSTFEQRAPSIIFIFYWVLHIL